MEIAELFGAIADKIAEKADLAAMQLAFDDHIGTLIFRVCDNRACKVDIKLNDIRDHFADFQTDEEFDAGIEIAAGRIVDRITQQVDESEEQMKKTHRRRQITRSHQ